MRVASDPAVALRSEADWDHEPFSVVKYMGSKRSLIPILAPEIAALCRPGERVVDLFAGTHVVGHSLRRRNRIVGVDAQGYSRVLGSALLCDSVDETASGIVERLKPHLSVHREAVCELYRRPLARERRLLRALLDAPTTDSKAVEAYADFQVSLPDPSSWSIGPPPRRGTFARLLRDLVEERRTTPNAFPYLLLLAYYANAYFGLEQALVLDGLRYAIDNEFPAGAGRDLCLAALLSAASQCTSTPGHFAMWRLIRTPGAAADIARYRERNPLAYFVSKLEELVAARGKAGTGHEVLVADAITFVRSYDEPVGAVYIDPPYSPVHYSRFYHVLEELVDYDYPHVFFGGRFPADRYVSPWSVRTQAADAFDELLHALAARGWPAVISYGANGIVSEATLVRLCQRTYGNAGVELRHVATRHASMGRADRGARATRELLVTCRLSKTARTRLLRVAV